MVHETLSSPHANWCHKVESCKDTCRFVASMLNHVWIKRHAHGRPVLECQDPTLWVAACFLMAELLGPTMVAVPSLEEAFRMRVLAAFPKRAPLSSIEQSDA